MSDIVTEILLWTYRMYHLLSIIPKGIESIRQPVMTTVLNSTLLFFLENGFKRAMHDANMRTVSLVMRTVVKHSSTYHSLWGKRLLDYNVRAKIFQSN